ncbi:MAG: phosphoribosylglycinamide formyltransferase, partial [Candidatus Scatosoma sp.]
MLNGAEQKAAEKKEAAEQAARAAAEKIKIAVLVSGGGTNLQALLDAEKAGKLPDGEIVLVLSDRADAYALQRAQSAGKKAFSVDKTLFSSGAEREGEMRRILEENGAELLVLAGFLSLLSKEFTGAYEGRIINVHPSL